jgi:hypothetical protein
VVEILSYALVLTSNHIYTSGATGTNAVRPHHICRNSLGGILGNFSGIWASFGRFPTG